jgi:SpoVK/Ycf46/Vps4 family AAA+-type ATPase
VVRLEAVVGAYLGQTASRVRDIFRFAEQSPSVILLDEVDAIGRRRGGQTDVGEIDRVVISLMQELEHAEPQGLVIATSNLPEQLDGALFRRFDEVVGFPRPTRRELSQFASSMAKAHAILPPRGVAKLVAASRSYADAKRKVEDAERRMTMARLLDATKS